MCAIKIILRGSAGMKLKLLKKRRRVSGGLLLLWVSSQSDSLNLLCSHVFLYSQESEARTDLLRSRSRKRAHEESSQEVVPSSTTPRHVNFFQDIEDGEVSVQWALLSRRLNWEPLLMLTPQSALSHLQTLLGLFQNNVARMPEYEWPLFYSQIAWGSELLFS